jgi:hypothetical protein
VFGRALKLIRNVILTRMNITKLQKQRRTAFRFPDPGGLFPWVGIMDGRTGDGRGESISGTSKLLFLGAREGVLVV